MQRERQEEAERFILTTSNCVATPSPLPAIDDEDTPLPSELEPSDHIAIKAQLDRR